jgi:oxygen-dependent protoporphyrinogen oxidase
MKPVVIVGGGITGLAAAWELQRQGCDYILLEASGRLGGKIVTERADGFIIEGAADSFLTTKPAAWQLCREIELADRLIGTNDARRNVYVLKDGQLHLIPRGLRLLVPTDPEALLESTLFSDEGKRQMLAETVVPPRPESGDESLGSFVRRRFGPEALDVLGEPLLAGIYTGDPETLSMAATFPNYLALERQFGSVTQGTLETPAAPPDPELPQTAFVSLRNGMQELIEGLQAALTGPVRLNAAVEGIDENGVIRLAGGEKIATSAVILTIPAGSAAPLLSDNNPQLALELARMRTISSATVTFGYKENELPGPLDGFGFVVARNEPTRLLASTWSSAKLPGRAPAGSALLRVFLGGHRGEDDAFLPDAELVALARTELRQVMGIEATPVIRRIFRWHSANPQYEVGHLAWFTRVQDLSPAWLQLAGASYGGVGIPDCVRQGREKARLALSNL